MMVVPRWRMTGCEESDRQDKAVEPLVKRAMEALRRYHLAQGMQQVEEVERFRLEVEALFRTVSEYQFRMLGVAVGPSH